MKHLFLIFGLLASGLALPGCSDNGKATQSNTTATNAAITDSTQLLAYVCPMGCEGSGSDKPGKCRVCDMDLIKNPNFKTAPDSVAR